MTRLIISSFLAWAARVTLPLILLVSFVGCTPHLELYPEVEGLARQGKYTEAAELVEKNQEEYGERNEVLFNMDRGILYHYARNYSKSNAAFEAAERRIDALFTESVSGNVAAFATNDTTLPYKGEDFESVVINIYRALNYTQLGDVDSALVEARKVNHKLDLINRQYDEDKKNVYAEDGFARLLMGALYEMGGTRDDVNDAYISNQLAVGTYKKAFAKNYGVSAPTILKSNLLTTASFMGREELGKAKKDFPGQPLLSLDDKRGKAQIYFVHFAGKSPEKVEDAIRAAMPDGNLLKIAFPRYNPRYYLIDSSRILIDGQHAVTLEPAEPIGSIAIENLSNRKARIAVKAIARATTKYIANKAVQNKARQESQAAGLLAWAAGTAFAEFSEQADLRSWKLLPDRMLIAGTLVDPGKHAITAEFLNRSRATVSSQALGDFELKAGETRFVLLHSTN